MLNYMNEPVPNIPLLRKILDHIDAHPDEWRQDAWAIQTDASSCGTAFCIAGHAVVMSGGQIEWKPDVWNDVYARMPDGLLRTIDAAAQDLLGLTRDERAWLFRGGNNRTEVQSAAERIACRAGEQL